MKFLYIFLVFLYVSMLSASSNNFTIKDSCFMDIQNLRNSHKNDYYNSLVFDKEIDDAKKQSKKEILKKINLQIQSTAILYFESKKSTKDKLVINDTAKQRFKEDIKTNTLDLDLNSLNIKEYYCKEDNEIFYLSLIKRKDVYAKTKEILKSLSKKNKRILSDIKSSNNPIEKLLLFEKIQTNYLPYLMILESAKIDLKLRNKYFNEIKNYNKLYRNFMKNTLFYVSIEYFDNPYYPVEERVDEIRQEIIKILARYSVFATNTSSIKEVKKILNKSKKDIALININLKDMNTDSDNCLELVVDLKSANKSKKKVLKSRKKFSIKYPKYKRSYEINFIKSLKEYDEKNSLIKQLG